ncbi:MAG TPA: cation-translocating P-type ATPase C-terminal domain-containing protein, partial [Anaerolineaceae bacterium]
GVFSRGAGTQTAWVGALIGALALGLGAWYYFGGQENWQTLVFTALAFAQVGQALASRSSTAPLWKIGLRSNPLMLSMAAAVIGLQLLVVYLPPLQSFLGTQPLGVLDLTVAVGAGLLVYGAIEAQKLLATRSKREP